MTSDGVDRFTELLCSRLCHDLISPIGAINNGIELMSDGEAAIVNDAIALIGSSSRHATARLAYYRLAFGAWGSDASTSFGTLRKIVDDHFRQKKCPVAWDGPTLAEDYLVAKDVGKLVLSLLLVAGDCVQRDGKVCITLDLSVTNPRIGVAVEGERCKLRDDIRDGLDADLADGDLTVRNVIAQHCRRLCSALAFNLEVADRGTNSLEFRAASH